MFDCCRVPGPQGLDWSVSYATPDDTGDSGHVVVLRHGRFWRLDLAPSGALLSTPAIGRQLAHIVAHSPADGAPPAVGTLTTNNRDVWARDYAALAADARNRTVLQAIHSAAFVLVLDATQPTDIVAHSRALWHGVDAPTGGLQTRWADKPLNLVVFDNGKAGIMGEHSVMDGTPTVTFCDMVLDLLATPSFDHGTSSPASELEPPQPLDFAVSAQTARAIDEAEAAFRELTDGQALGMHRTAYGKRAIKTFGVSPDSWAQLLVQLAYARLLRARGEPKRCGGTYEAATTRRFARGRTETIRVVTRESDAWVASMDDTGVGAAERRALFAAASARHIQLAREAGGAQGVDRHLLGARFCLLSLAPLLLYLTYSLTIRALPPPRIKHNRPEDGAEGR
jgi:carnitine O-acetyltransferase